MTTNPTAKSSEGVAKEPSALAMNAADKICAELWLLSRIHLTQNDRRNAAAIIDREATKPLADALRELRDIQNGPPLETWREQWQAAVDKADALLSLYEGTKGGAL